MRMKHAVAIGAVTMMAAGVFGAASANSADAASPGDIPPNPLDKPGYYLTAHDEFDVDGAELSPDLWNTKYLPHWSSVENEARYTVGNGGLALRIDEDTPAWDPAYDGSTKISGIQTAERDGLHKWNANYPGIDHHEPTTMQHIQRYGYFELRAKVAKGGGLHSAWWMIGAQQDAVPGNDPTTQNSEVDIFEILGRDTSEGLFNWHPWKDPDAGSAATVFGNGTDLSANFHVYGFEWTPTEMNLYLDNELVQTIDGSPDYPMLTLLGLYEKTDPGSWTGPFDPTIPYPKEFTIDYFRAYQKIPDETYTLEIDDAALYGSARSVTVAGASGDRVVGDLGQGEENRAVLDELYAAASGTRTLTLSYASAETRDLTYRVNGGDAMTVSLPPTGGWTTFGTSSFDVQLEAGNNTIEFWNGSGWAPDLDTLTVAPAEATEPTDPTDPTEQPTDPTEQPTDPTEQPTIPTDQPTEPSETPAPPVDTPDDSGDAGSDSAAKSDALAETGAAHASAWAAVALAVLVSGALLLLTTLRRRRSVRR